MQAGCFKERESVESPGLPVEVDSEKPTSIIKKQRIDAEDKILPTCVGPNAIIAPQVAFDYVIVHGNEGLVRALTTLDLRLPTDTADPFIVACRRIS